MIRKAIPVFIFVFFVSLAAYVFAFVVTHGTMNLRQIDPASFSFNYINALDNLKIGRFDLTPDTAGGQLGELFHRNGKAYTYYGIFPALFRGFVELFVSRGKTDWARISLLTAALISV